MSAWVVVVAIAAGALGAVARYGVTLAFGARPARVPWAVLVANVVGSGIAGVALALTQSGVWGTDVGLVVLSGFCGGLTTFSALSVETIELVLDGRTRAAVASVAGNLVLGVAAAAATWAIATAVTG